MIEHIGKYEILGELGRGGMGVVYKAYDPVIGRTVALKVILENLVHADDIKKRFYREARSVGRLSHENITIVYDVSEEKGQPYLVMEYLDGRNLRQLLLEKPSLPFEDRLQIARQICSGLHYAHRHEVVHRDIKPENICVLAKGRVKIMDFGIARIQNEAQTLTQTNMSLGTPRYMSPEQIKGEDLDGRSDIFAFGVLFYEMLTGVNPFSGERLTTVIYKVLNADPPPLALEPSVLSRRLTEIVERCLAKDRSDRYADCGLVKAALEEVLANEDPALLMSVPASPMGAPSSLPTETVQEMPAEEAATEEMTLSPAVPLQEPPRVEPPEEAMTEEMTLSLAIPLAERPRVERPEEAATEEMTVRLAEPLRERPRVERPEEAATEVTPLRRPAPRRESLPPTPAEAPSPRKTASNKYLLAVLGIFLAAILVVGAYLIITADSSETQPSIPSLVAESESLPGSNTPGSSERPVTEENGSAEATPGAEPEVPVSAAETGGGTVQDEAVPVSDGAARQAAESARTAMDQARRRVGERGADAEVADLFERAEARRQSGNSQFGARDYGGAATSFRQASGLFDQIKQVLDKKDAVVAGETDTPGDAEILSVDAWTREDAAAAQTAMQAAKDNVASALRRTPIYQEALALENQATQFFGAQLYARAGPRFGAAEAKYKEASVAQATATIAPELQAAVTSFAQTLKASIEQEDSNGMRAMSYRDRDWGAFFATAEAVTAVVSPGTVQASGNSATVPVRVALTYRDEQNQPRQETLSHLWTLQNQGDDWMLIRVRPVQ